MLEKKEERDKEKNRSQLAGMVLLVIVIAIFSLVFYTVNKERMKIEDIVLVREVWNLYKKKNMYETYYKEHCRIELLTRYKEIVRGMIEGRNKEELKKELSSEICETLPLKNKLCYIEKDLFVVEIKENLKKEGKDILDYSIEVPLEGFSINLTKLGIYFDLEKNKKEEKIRTKFRFINQTKTKYYFDYLSFG